MYLFNFEDWVEVHIMSLFYNIQIVQAIGIIGNNNLIKLKSERYR